MDPAGMDDRFWRVACHRDRIGTPDRQHTFDEQPLRHHRYRSRTGRARVGGPPGALRVPGSWYPTAAVKLASRGCGAGTRCACSPRPLHSLPGLPFPGEPYALPVKDALRGIWQAYVGLFALPVRPNMRVLSLARDADASWSRRRRDIHGAFGHRRDWRYHRAYIPAFASGFSPSLEQRHSSEYRNPSALPPGRVLVVGAGNSGAQLR